MAGISIPVSLGDNVSSPFDKMTNSVRETIRAFEDLNEVAKTGLKPPTEPLRGIGERIKANTQAQREFNTTVTQAQTPMQSLLSLVKSVGVAFLSFQGAKKMFTMADSISQTVGRISLMTGNLEQANSMMKQIYLNAQETRASFGDVSNAVAKIGVLAPQAFKSNDEILRFTNLMNKSFKIGGAGIQEQTAAMHQLTQALASGKLQGDEFRSILENAPMLAQAIQKELGGIDMKKASSEGLITADVIKRAMFNSADDINKKFNEMPLTLSDIGTKIKNNFLIGLQPLASALQNLLKNEHIKSFIDGLIIPFRILGKVAAGVINGINASVNLLAPVFQFLKPVIMGVVSVLGLYALAMGAISMWHGIVAATETIHAAVMIAWSIATGQMTLAQWGLNSALLACPLTWIVLAVIAVIVAYFMLINTFNTVTGSHISGIGIICGAFMYLWTVILNICKYIGNIFLSLAEFLANVFNHPIYSIIRLFVNLGKNALTVARGITSCFDSVATNIANAFVDGANMAIRAINWIIEALNHIPGVNLGKIGEIGHTTSITHSIDNKIANIDKWLNDTKPNDYKSAKHFEFNDPMKAFSNGYKFGEGLSNKIKDMTNLDKLKEKVGGLMGDKEKIINPQEVPGLGGKGAGGEPNRHLKSIDNNSAKTAKNTEAVLSDVRRAKGIAERQAINKFTTATINIENNVSNNNPNMDLDGFVDGLTDKLQKELEIHVDGYYSTV